MPAPEAQLSKAITQVPLNFSQNRKASRMRLLQHLSSQPQLKVVLPVESKDGMSMNVIPRPWLDRMRSYYKIITATKDVCLEIPADTTAMTDQACEKAIDKINEFYGRQQFAVSPFFAPAMVDACCQSGVFPMAVDVGDIFLFAAKLHNTRGITSVVKCPHCVASCLPSHHGEPLAALTVPQIGRRLAKKCSVMVDCFFNETMEMIVSQHGENWLCAELQAAFRWIFLHPELFKTQLHTIVIFNDKKIEEGFKDLVEAKKRNQQQQTSSTRVSSVSVRQNNADISVLNLKEMLTPEEVTSVYRKAIVAVEAGFVVMSSDGSGGIYTSLTGAYSESGCGSLQLAVLGAMLHLTNCTPEQKQHGITHWDLGMLMAYKKDTLGVKGMTRRQWLQLILDTHRGKSRSQTQPNIEDARTHTSEQADADENKEQIPDCHKMMEIIANRQQVLDCVHPASFRRRCGKWLQQTAVSENIKSTLMSMYASPLTAIAPVPTNCWQLLQISQQS